MKGRSALILLVVAVLGSACSDDAAPATTAMSSSTAAPVTTAPVTTAAPETTAAPVTTTAPATTATTTTRVPATEFPVVVPHDAGVTEIATKPMRIAALSATHVEMLFAIGAGPQVIAGDLFSNYPPREVERLDLIDAFNLNVEAVVALEPDLVVLAFDPGEAVDALETVGVPTVLFGTAADLDEVYGQIRALGRATGHEEEAEGLVTEMKAEITAIGAEAGDAIEGMTFYHESDPFSYYTPNSSSFIGGLYELLGMDNIADAAPDPSSSGFPQLSAEFIVASDPEIVFLAGFGETAQTLAAREGWDTLSAVRNGNVVVLDTDVASRWGPRVVDLVRAIAAGAVSAREG